MRDDERPAARRLGAQQRRELRLPLGIDPARRLVEDQQVRLRREHRREREALALADGEIARMPLRVIGEPELGERVARARRVGAERDLVERLAR